MLGFTPACYQIPKGTMNADITYTRQENVLQIKGYCDSDRAGNLNCNRQSTSGFCLCSTLYLFLTEAQNRIALLWAPKKWNMYSSLMRHAKHVGFERFLLISVYMINSPFFSMSTMKEQSIWQRSAVRPRETETSRSGFIIVVNSFFVV